MSALALEEVTFSYGPERFIDRLSIAVQPGELVGLMGPNGSGKSTILRLAAGILRPRKGGIAVCGRAVGSLGGRTRAGLVAFLPQILDMQAPFRTEELIALGATAGPGGQGLGVDEAMLAVGLDAKADAFLADLSGGERRRAYIAMTLVQGAMLLLLDEPLANLDLRYQLQLVQLLRDIARAKGIAVFVSLHEIWIGALLDRLVVVKEGRVLADGTPQAALTASTLQAAYDLAGPIDTLPLPERSALAGLLGRGNSG